MPSAAGGDLGAILQNNPASGTSGSRVRVFLPRQPKGLPPVDLGNTGAVLLAPVKQHPGSFWGFPVAFYATLVKGQQSLYVTLPKVIPPQSNKLTFSPGKYVFVVIGMPWYATTQGDLTVKDPKTATAVSGTRPTAGSGARSSTMGKSASRSAKSKSAAPPAPRKNPPVAKAKNLLKKLQKLRGQGPQKPFTSNFSPYDITSGADFVKNVMADTDFRHNGYLYGHNGDIYWAAVNPIRKPLYVWKKNPLGKAATYVQSAHNLNAVVFSNGPLMTDDLKPYGPVHSNKNAIDDPGAKKLDDGLYALGRKTPAATGIAFGDYEVFKAQNAKKDATVAGYAEAIIGLYPLIFKGKAFSKTPGNADYNQSFANFIKTATIVAWALVDPPKGEETGLIIAAGQGEVLSTTKNQKVVDVLVSIGVRDAVATDGGSSVWSTSSMLGEHKQSWFDPAEIPGAKKQSLQQYGFYCGDG